MNFDIGALGASVCAISCACMGSLLILAFVVIRVVGIGVLPLVAEVMGGFFGDDDIEKDKRDSAARTYSAQSAAQSLRERARASSFDSALQQYNQGGISAQQAPPSAQGLNNQAGFPQSGGLNQPPRPGLSMQRPASNDPLAPPAPRTGSIPQSPGLPSLSQPSPARQDDYRPPLRRGGSGSLRDGTPGLRNRDSRRRENDRLYDDSDDDGLFEFFDM